MRFASPETTAEAIENLAGEAGVAYVLSGGTDLLVKLRSQMIEPDLVVDLKRIEGLKAIVRDAGGWRIGAAVPSAEIGEHEGFCKAWPGVVEAAGLIGSTQVQGRATLAGNLCNASPAADSVPAMIAANASVRVVGPNGERDVAVEDIPSGVGTISLGKAEFITSVYFPDPEIPAGGGHGDAYLRFIPRTEMDIAVVGCGVALTLEANGVVCAARIALGAVAPTALRIEEAEQALIGKAVDQASLEHIAEICSRVVQPISDKRGTAEFRKHVAGVLAKRTAKIAADRAVN